MTFKTVSRLFILVVLTAMTLQADARGGAPNGTQQEDVSGQSARGYIALELLTQTEGADFNNYLHAVYMASKKRWFANMPPSAMKGQRGVNVVTLRILQDGTVPEEFIKIKTTSGKADLDEASLASMAAPFGKLPADFTAPYIELRFTFFYNLEPTPR